MKSTTVICGASACTGFGVGVDALYDHFARGLYQSSPPRDDPAFQDVAKTGDRLTTPLLSAVACDLSISLKELTRLERQRTVVAIGNPTGNLEPCSMFYKAGLRHGYAGVDAAQFSCTMLNHPAVQLGHRYDLTGTNATIASGFSSGLDAIGYASQRIGSGKAMAAVAGGVEATNELNLSFVRDQISSSSRPRPLCDDRDGTVPTSALGLLFLRSTNATLNGGAGSAIDSRHRPKILSYCSSKGSLREEAEATLHRGMNTIRNAIGAADLVYQDIDAIFPSANGTREDEIELEMLRGVFASTLERLPVYPTKAVYGECFAAAGPLQCIAALYAMQQAPVFRASGNLNWYNGLLQPAYLSRCECALVYVLGPDRSLAAIVIGKA